MIDPQMLQLRVNELETLCASLNTKVGDLTHENALLVESLKTVGDAAMEADMLGGMERLLDPTAGNGAVRLSRILNTWHTAKTERDAMKAQLDQLQAKKGSVYISEDYTVWGSSDSINKLTDHLDDLERQNTLSMEALKFYADWDKYDKYGILRVDHAGDKVPDYGKTARTALATVKENTNGTR